MEPLTRLLGDAHRFVPDVKLYINFLNELSVVPAPEAATQCDGDGHEAQKQSMRTYLSHHSITMHCLRLVRYKRRASPVGNISAGPQRGKAPVFLLKENSSGTQRRKRTSTKPQILLFSTAWSCAPRHCGGFRPRSRYFLSPPLTYPISNILFPATHYSHKSSLYSSWWDRSWGAEKNAVYWAGSSTGGHWTAHTWAKGHPQRLVALATGKAETSTGAKVDISHLDVALTRIVGCEPRPVCDVMSRFFWGGLPDTTTGGRSSRGPDPENRALRYRFALDVSGNSFSGRFYRRLASRGVPLKINIFREWHDDRLRA